MSVGRAGASGLGRTALASACVLACGCGSAAAPSSGAPRDGGGLPEFIAFASSFEDYRAWSHFTVFDDGGAGGAVHVATTLIEYRNDPDASSDPGFPLGTIIVKEAPTGDPDTRQAFAMVKRGGGFNASGAAGWEWFELQNVDDAGHVQIEWRGVEPPMGEVYSGNVSGECNDCHEHAPHDDVFAQ
jgi:hypothetical protein